MKLYLSLEGKNIHWGVWRRVLWKIMKNNTRG